MARTVSDEAGKPIKAARVEVTRAISTYTTSAAVARTLVGEMVPMDASPAGEGKLGLTLRRPVGVVGAISPFNFPCNLVAHKIAPALAAGCPVVLKPASATPLSALLLAELEFDAGLPPGWLNVVVGRASEIGDTLVEDERVKLITFTGSGEVGWALAQRVPGSGSSSSSGTRRRRSWRRTPTSGSPRRSSPRAHSPSPAGLHSVQRIYVERTASTRFSRCSSPASRRSSSGPCR